MDTRHLIAPELLAGLDLMPNVEVTADNLLDLRAGAQAFDPRPEDYARPGVAMETLTVPGPDGAPDVRVTVYRPVDARAPLPVLLHFHGGGYVLGTLEGNGPTCTRTADEVGCVVVSVDYRLAPETLAPGQIEDGYAVLKWIHREAEARGFDTRRIAVGGESAGGGLAAALAIMVRDRGEFALCFQQLIYPMIDDRTGSTQHGSPQTGKFVWSRESNRFGWSALLGREPGGEGVSSHMAAAREEDLSDLPPAYISVGSLDLFLDEDIAYAQRLMAAGVATELHVYPGAYHGYELAMDAALVIDSERERRVALSRAFAGPA